MSLLTPSFGWNFRASSHSGTPSQNTPGVNLSAGASNADGATVQILSALAQDVQYLVLGVGSFAVAAGNGQTLLTIVYDPAGGTSWVPLINYLVVGFSPIVNNLTPLSLWFHFPIWIPAGSTVGVMARTRHTVDMTTGRVIAHAYGQPTRPELWWCGTQVETIGVDNTISQGTNFTPGNSGAWGSWTDIGSTSVHRHGAIQWGVNGSDDTATAIGYFAELGIRDSSSNGIAIPGSPIGYWCNTTSEVGARNLANTLIYVNHPIGTQYCIRATGSGTAEIHNAAVYGVY